MKAVRTRLTNGLVSRSKEQRGLINSITLLRTANWAIFKIGFATIKGTNDSCLLGALQAPAKSMTDEEVPS